MKNQMRVGEELNRKLVGERFLGFILTFDVSNLFVSDMGNKARQ